MEPWFSCFSVLAAGLMASAATSTTNAVRPDLTGQVVTADGSGLTDATVFIDTAGPRVGRGTL